MKTLHDTPNTIIALPADLPERVRGHWTQGAWEDGDRACLHGHIRRCALQPGDAYMIQQVAERHGWGTSWNDASGRTEDEVVAVIRQHLVVTDGELEATFGPQWEQIVALVRRAAVLTEDESRRLHAARHAASDAAGDAARYAASDAAGDAARYAAGDAARYAASDAARYAASDAAWYAARYAAAGAARYAAGDAASALVVRDLIGANRFTQAHYDTLTGPWRQVIGPVHPDDAEAVA